MSNVIVAWVGISQKPDTSDLSEYTNTGKIIKEIEEKTPHLYHYKTNLVSFAPMNGNGKLRYPSQKEIDASFDDLMERISSNDSKIIFLLGGIVVEAFERNAKVKLKKWNGFNYYATGYKNFVVVPVHHPSYISVYKRKHRLEYIDGILQQIDSCPLLQGGSAA
jgi:DNA polymerase